MSLDVKALDSLIRNSGLTYRENSVSWIFECPRCNKRDKLYLRKRDGQFVCWFCATTEGYKGRAEYALRDLLRKPVFELQEKLYGNVPSDTALRPRLEFHDFFGDEDEIPFDLMPVPAVAWPEEFFELDHPHAARGLAYLEGRGIDLATAMQLGLRYFPQERRVIFPIVAQQRLVGWQARTIIAGVIPKILTGPKTFKDRDRVLMGQDELEGAEAAILVEGPVDKYKCRLCPAAVVCSMGKSVSGGQLALIKASKTLKRLYLGIDPDAAAEKTRLCREFSHLELFEMLPPRHTVDLGEMSAEDVVSVFRSARHITAGRVFLAPYKDFFSVSTVQGAE
jgi:hypothetical protein